MKQHKTYLLNATVFALLARNNRANAAVPISVDSVSVIVTTESHWISVNTEALTGDVQKGSIGANTELLTEDGGHTKWIGKNTQYITDIVQTATVSGAATTVTSFPNIKIIGPVDDDGNPTGAFDVIMAPALAAQVQELANQQCPEKSAGNRTCSGDFAPRVQSLLRGGTDGVLTERFIILASTALVMFIAIGIQMWLIAHREPLIPEIIHIENIHTDNDSYRGPIFTTIASHYVVTLTTYPKQTQVVSAALPLPTLVDNEDGSDCWLYTGVDVEPLTEDDIAEAYDDDHQDKPSTKRGLPTVDKDPTRSKIFGEDVRRLGRLRRGIAGRISLLESALPTITRRQDDEETPKFITQIGMCDTSIAKPGFQSIVRAQIHPKPGMVMAPYDLQNNGPNHGLDPELWWWVPTQDISNRNCPIADLIKKGRRYPNNPDNSRDNFPPPYNQRINGVRLTVEHIYEVATIHQFFKSELNTIDDPRCKAFIEMFDKPDTGLQAGKDSRFFSLWAQNSNPTPGNWALAGVDGRVNNLKGKMLEPNLEGWPKISNGNHGTNDALYDKLFQTWNNAVLSIDFINLPQVKMLFGNRNNAVHAAFLAFDNIIACETDNDHSESFSWAEAYKKYMSDLLTKNEQLMKEKIRAIIQKIDQYPEKLTGENGVRTKYGKAYDSLKSTYPESYFKFDHSMMLRYSPGHLDIRDTTQTNTCVRPKPTAACVEKKIVDCYYQYIDRFDLPIAECPPTPVLPAYCADRTTAPIVPVSPGYCVPQDDLHACTLAVAVRSGEKPVNAFIYDYRCNPIGNGEVPGGTASLTSQLPYTVEIEHLTVLFGGLELRFAYAGQVKEQERVDSGAGRHDCSWRDYSDKDRIHHVTRCPFDCSAKRS